jgi:hypothetical protein
MTRFTILPAVAIGLAALSIAGMASAAPTGRECAAASEASIPLRTHGKLVEAKERLLVCTDAACPGEIREECARQLAVVESATASVIFDVRDGAGHDLTAVRVSIDGAPLVERLDAAAIAVDPGAHTFRFEPAGASPAPAVEKAFVIVEGEKNRHLAITLGAALTSSTPPPPHAKAHWPMQKTLALVAGGTGIAGIGLGVAFGLVASSSWSNARGECGAGCSATSPAQSDKNSASSQATLSTVGFIAGGVLVAGATVLWFTAPSGAQVQVGPSASADGAGLLVRGTF